MEYKTSGKRVYLGNLAWDTTEARLRSVLALDGRTVTSIKIKTDPGSGRSRGFAFADFASEAEAQAAIAALNGTQLDGREIKVHGAKEQRSGSGGFGRGPSRGHADHGERDEGHGGYGGRGRGGRW
jgi:RNA recognition motif-containing protein